MALETLRGIDQINGRQIVVMDDLRAKHPERFTETGAMDHKWFEETIRPNAFIYVRNDKNSLSFTIQNGPVKEAGVNGCQIDDVIAVAKTILEGLNEKVPNYHNKAAIAHLGEALARLNERRIERERRMVEGTSKK